MGGWPAWAGGAPRAARARRQALRAVLRCLRRLQVLGHGGGHAAIGQNCLFEHLRPSEPTPPLPLSSFAALAVYMQDTFFAGVWVSLMFLPHLTGRGLGMFTVRGCFKCHRRHRPHPLRVGTNRERCRGVTMQCRAVRAGSPPGGCARCRARLMARK